jgi:hypothetical protein
MQNKNSQEKIGRDAARFAQAAATEGKCRRLMQLPLKIEAWRRLTQDAAES